MLERQVFGCGQRHTWCKQTFDGWIVGFVEEQHRTGKSACLFKAVDELTCFTLGDTHCGENHGETFALAEHFGLTGNLKRQVVVG